MRPPICGCVLDEGSYCRPDGDFGVFTAYWKPFWCSIHFAYFIKGGAMQSLPSIYLCGVELPLNRWCLDEWSCHLCWKNGGSRRLCGFALVPSKAVSWPRCIKCASAVSHWSSFSQAQWPRCCSTTALQLLVPGHSKLFRGSLSRWFANDW